MPHSVAIIDYQKWQPGKCGDGVCAAEAECPNKVLRQEAAYEFPFPIHPISAAAAPNTRKLVPQKQHR
ncbi:MAG: hypothetical protein MUO89_03650 [Dehalococcoidia bacterium]|nr:hypothetical protein [Dehalococcoidia bacterium]